MTPILFLLVVKAEVPPPPENWEIVRHVFRHDDVNSAFDILHGVITVAVVAVAILMAMSAYRWFRQRRFRSRPMQVFHRLADELGLVLADQWLLIRIAHRQSLPTPLTLLLSTATLRYHAERYAQALSPRSRGKMMARITAIDAALFGPA